MYKASILGKNPGYTVPDNLKDSHYFLRGLMPTDKIIISVGYE